MNYYTEIKNTKEYDVIIAGSGPAGISAAIMSGRNRVPEKIHTKKRLYNSLRLSCAKGNWRSSSFGKKHFRNSYGTFKFQSYAHLRRHRWSRRNCRSNSLQKKYSSPPRWCKRNSKIFISNLNNVNFSLKMLYNIVL